MECFPLIMCGCFDPFDIRAPLTLGICNFGLVGGSDVISAPGALMFDELSQHWFG